MKNFFKNMFMGLWRLIKLPFRFIWFVIIHIPSFMAWLVGKMAESFFHFMLGILVFLGLAYGAIHLLSLLW